MRFPRGIRLSSPEEAPMLPHRTRARWWVPSLAAAALSAALGIVQETSACYAYQLDNPQDVKAIVLAGAGHIGQ
jgi:hypothetical protein